MLGEGPLERPGARLCLQDGPLRTAARCRYGKRPELEKMAHLLTAGDCGPVNPRGIERGAWRSPSSGLLTCRPSEGMVLAVA